MGKTVESFRKPAEGEIGRWSGFAIASLHNYLIEVDSILV